jgi:hypothetical protein
MILISSRREYSPRDGNKYKTLGFSDYIIREEIIKVKDTH